MLIVYAVPFEKKRKTMSKLGVMINLRPDTDIAEEMRKAQEIGCECCQLSVWDMSLYTDENAARIRAAAEQHGIEISTLWTGWSGSREWNFTGGPMTLGVVPEAYRMQRAENIIDTLAYLRDILG